jgi:hypothetical protein
MRNALWLLPISYDPVTTLTISYTLVLYDHVSATHANQLPARQCSSERTIRQNTIPRPFFDIFPCCLLFRHVDWICVLLCSVRSLFVMKVQ